MATTSTIPTVKAALVSLVGTALASSGAGSTAVQVTYGRPADGELAHECVWVGDVTGQHRVPTIKAGRKPREETYSVEVVAWVASHGGTVAEAEARAFVLLAEVEDVVADDPSLGLVSASTPVFFATAGQFDTASDLIGGPVGVVRLNIDCTARLA